MSGTLRSLAATILVLLGACDRGRSNEIADAALRMMNDTVPVLVGAGDIADCKGDAVGTSAILDTIRGTIFVAGDVGYASKKIPNPLWTCYDPTWGRHRARTRPVPGNHEYANGRADAYFKYFGDLAGPRGLGYYGYDLGTWRVVALNTNLPTGPGTPQHDWLQRELESNLGRCTVVYMHHPRFSSGPHVHQEQFIPLFRTLTRFGVSVAIAGHDHMYERFAPLDADGNPDSLRGIRQFVAGTGGVDRYKIKAVVPGSEARSGDAYGVLKLTLLPGLYRWDFIPVKKKGFRDDGEAACRPTNVAD